MTRFEKRSPTTSAEATTSSATTCASPAEATAAAEATTTAAAATATETAATTASASRETAAATAATESATTATASGETTGTTAAAASTSTTAPGLLDLGSSRRGLGLGQELLEGEELLAADEELVAGLEAGGLDAVAGLDGEVDLVDGAEDLVDLADGRLVLEEDLGVEVRDLWVGGLADHFTLAGVHEGAELEDLGRGAKVALSETAAACFVMIAKVSEIACAAYTWTCCVWLYATATELLEQEEVPKTRYNNYLPPPLPPPPKPPRPLGAPLNDIFF
jgi:hypothetical protein